MIVMESSPEGGTSSRSGGVSSAGGGHFPLPFVGKTLSIRCSPASSGVDFRLYLLHVFIFKSRVFSFFLSPRLFFCFLFLQSFKVANMNKASLWIVVLGWNQQIRLFFCCLGEISCSSNKSKSKCVL